MNSFEDILDYFKKNETPENIVSLISNEKLTNALVAWQSVIIQKEIDNKNIPENKNDNEKWEWIWSCIDFDMKKYAVVSGLQEHEINNLFIRLKGLKLIYPDGKISELAKQYLQGVIMAKLPKRRK